MLLCFVWVKHEGSVFLSWLIPKFTFHLFLCLTLFSNHIDIWTFLSLPSELFAMTILIYQSRIKSYCFQEKEKIYIQGQVTWDQERDTNIWDEKSHLDSKKSEINLESSQTRHLDLAMHFKHSKKRFLIILICIYQKSNLKCDYEEIWII